MAKAARACGSLGEWPERAGDAASPDNSASTSRRCWIPVLAGGLLPMLLYIVLPYGKLAGAVYVVATFLAAIAVALALRQRPRTFCPTAWGLIAGALALAGVGHAIWYWLDLRGLEPFPAAPDFFYLAVYPLFGGALWMLGRQSGEGEGALSDALIVGIAAAVLGWAVLIAPYVHDPSLTMVQLLVSTAYPVADLILLPLILRLVFLYRTRVSAHLFLLIGMLAYLVADMLYAHGNSAGWYAPGGFTDGLWLAAYALFVVAAWHPTAGLEPRTQGSSPELSGRRLMVLGAAAVTVPGMILLTAGTAVEIVRVAAIGSILLFLLVMHRLAGLMKETRRQAAVLESLSRTDHLTGAANRRHLEYELEREVARAERANTALSFVFLDLDRFKRFNDTYGHAAGDTLLQELVAIWQGVLRPTDVLARMGGEEFVIVSPDTTAEQCRQMVERLRGLVPRGQTCSAGIAAFQPGESVDAFTGRADRALYEAKHQGRDRVIIAEQTAGMDETTANSSPDRKDAFSVC